MFFAVCILIIISIFSPWVVSNKEIWISSISNGKGGFINLNVRGYQIFWGQLSIAFSVSTLLLFIFRYKRICMMSNLFMIAIAVYFYFDGAGVINWEVGSRTFPVSGAFSFGFYLYSFCSIILVLFTWLSYKKEQKIYDETKISFSTNNEEAKVENEISHN